MFIVREEQGLVVEIMKTREKEVINLLRFKFGILEQLFLAYFIQCDYVHAVQVPLCPPQEVFCSHPIRVVQELWKMLEMNCMWSSQNPEWSSTIHVLAGHLASVCLPKYAANHYINASQVFYFGAPNQWCRDLILSVHRSCRAGIQTKPSLQICLPALLFCANQQHLRRHPFQHHEKSLLLIHFEKNVKMECRLKMVSQNTPRR